MVESSGNAIVHVQLVCDGYGRGYPGLDRFPDCPGSARKTFWQSSAEVESKLSKGSGDAKTRTSHAPHHTNTRHQRRVLMTPYARVAPAPPFLRSILTRSSTDDSRTDTLTVRFLQFYDSTIHAPCQHNFQNKNKKN